MRKKRSRHAPPLSRCFLALGFALPVSGFAGALASSWFLLPEAPPALPLATVTAAPPAQSPAPELSAALLLPAPVRAGQRRYRPAPLPALTELASLEVVPTPPAEIQTAFLATPPSKPAVASKPAEQERTLTVKRGDTFLSLLRDAGVDDAEAREAVAAVAPVFPPSALSIGQEMRLLLQSDAAEAGKLEGLVFHASVEQDIWLERDKKDNFVARSVARPLTTNVSRASAEIATTLFGAARAANVPFPVLKEMISAFSYGVDLQRELQPGDVYEILYERVEDQDGNLARPGDLLYASLILRGERRAIYRFTPPGGSPEYFTADGRSVRKALLRTPIDGARISSGFGMRKHPILGYSKMHQGVDFAAPTGTPIYAAGDGVITKMGRNGGYGNYVQIRHPNGISTGYAHAKAFARGLSAGSKVKQGQIVAYVGTTGRSTGPHLHYEIIAQGQRIDPLSLKLPTGYQLGGKDLARFKAAVAQVDRMLANQREKDRVLVADRVQ